MSAQLAQQIIFGVVTVAFLVLAGFLLIMSPDPSLHTLAVAIITGLLGIWVPSPVQVHQAFAVQKAPATS